MAMTATVIALVGGLVIGLLFAAAFTAQIMKRNPALNKYRVFASAFLLSSLLVSLVLFFGLVESGAPASP